MYSSLGKFSRRQIDVFQYFSQNIGVDIVSRKQFAQIAKGCLLEERKKERKKKKKKWRLLTILLSMLGVKV